MSRLKKLWDWLGEHERRVPPRPEPNPVGQRGTKLEAPEPWPDPPPCKPSDPAKSTRIELRDYFAAKCPLTPSDFAPVYGMELEEILRDGAHSRVFWALYSLERYAYADAMLKARAEVKP